MHTAHTTEHSRPTTVVIGIRPVRVLQSTYPYDPSSKAWLEAAANTALHATERRSFRPFQDDQFEVAIDVGELNALDFGIRLSVVGQLFNELSNRRVRDLRVTVAPCGCLAVRGRQF